MSRISLRLVDGEENVSYLEEGGQLRMQRRPGAGLGTLQQTVVLPCFPARSHKFLPSAIPAASLGWIFLCQEGRGLSRREAMIWAFGETRCLFTHEKDLWLQYCCIFICWGKTLGFKQSSAASGEPGRKLHLYFRTLCNVVIQQKTLFSLSQKRITPPCLLWPFYVTQY